MKKKLQILEWKVTLLIDGSSLNALLFLPQRKQFQQKKYYYQIYCFKAINTRAESETTRQKKELFSPPTRLVHDIAVVKQLYDMYIVLNTQCTPSKS
jgi:hypothetical protein